MNCPYKHFTKQYIASAIAVFTVFVICIVFTHNAYAATGINRTINFQGKLVDNNGLNVADSTYSVVFSIYDRTSSGTTLWTETQSVTTVDGIFRVALGSSTAIPANFNFNWDGLYLGIKVGSDAEMTPRIRMAAVPYAFNAEKVAGLTVQDENGNASTSGTLKIPNGKTISFGGAFTTTAGNDLTFTTSGNSTLSLGGSGSLTLVDTTTAQTLTGKIIGSGGLTFTGATTDITTGTNENFALVPNGSGLIGLGTTSPSSFLHVYGGNQGGNALAIFDQRGASTNDIFTASAAGVPKFVIGNSGNVGIGTTLTSTYNLDVTGTARFTGAITVASCSGCGASSQWTTAGQSIYFSQAANQVGIGTTSPATLLHLYDTRGGNASLIVDQRGTNTPDIFTASSSGTTRFTIGNNGDLTLATGALVMGSTTRLTNTGIGTFLAATQITNAGPSYLQIADTAGSQGAFRLYTGLQAGVVDDFGITDGNAFPYIYVAGPSQAASIYKYGVGIGENFMAPQAVLHVSGGNRGGRAALIVDQTGALSNDIFTASASGIAKFVIRNNGNIGIGSTLPASTLYVNGTTTGNAAFTVVQNTATGDIFTASAGATPKFVIDRSGNVGIGSSNPTGFNLDVTGTARFTGAITVASCSGCSGSSAFSAITGGTNSTAAMIIDTGASLTFSNSGTINASSLLGNTWASPGTIGGTTPGIATFTALTANTSLSVAGNVGIGSTAVTPTWLTLSSQNKIASGKALAIFDQYENQDIFTASRSGVAKFVISKNGNIGVGTTLPASTLAINGTTSGNAALMVIQNTATGDIFTASVGATPKFVIDRSGNVGIGSSVPSGFNLDVTGTARFTGAITVASCSGCGGAGSQWTTSGNNIYYAPAAGGVGIGTTSPATLLHLYDQRGGNASLMIDQRNTNADIFTASSAGTPRFVIQSNGTLVTGTDVSGAISGGNIYSTTLAHFAGNTNSYAQVNVMNRSSGGSASSDFIATSNDGSDTTNYIDFGINSSGYNDAAYTIGGAHDGYLYTNGGNLTLGTQTAGKSLIFHTGGTLAANERMRIADNGNVGIGTTTINSLLEVYGTTTGKALAMFDQRTSTGDILTASASGTTKFVIDRSGNVGIGSSIPAASLDILTPTLTANGVYGTNLTTTFAPTAGGTQNAMGITITNNPSSSANSANGLSLSMTDSTTLGNTLKALNINVAATGDSTKNVYGGNIVVDDASSLAGGTVYGLNLAISRSGNHANVSQATEGIKISAQTNGTQTNGITNAVGLDSDVTTSGGSGGTINEYAIRAKSNSSFLTAASTATLNHYGVYIENQTMDTVGTTINTGLFIAATTGADTNYAALFAGGSVGMGTTTPTSQLNVTRALNMGVTGKALVVFDQIEKQDIFAASSSGVSRFVIAQNGNVGVGTVLPGSALTVNGTTTGNAALTVVQNTSTGDILSASAGATTKFVIDRGGNVGIGTSVPTSAKLVVSESSAPAIDMTQIVNSTGTSTTGVDGIQVDFKTAGVVASTDNSGLRVNVTSGNSGATTTLEGITIGDLSGAQANATETGLKIGTGWDTGISVASGGITVSGGGLTLSGASGMTYSGSARPTKTLVLSAEYPGATLTASGSAQITGTMTSDASPSATFGAGTNNWMNYYMWTTTSTSLQDYTVAVRATVPKDFSAWNTTALQVNYNTALTTTNTNKLDVLIYRAANATATPLFYGQANVSASAKTWKTVDVPSSALSTLVAGDTFVVYLRMYAKDSNYVQIGDIVLSYLAAF